MKNHIESAKNNWIYQSNKLIEASYTLTVIEQKLIRLLASMIKKDDTDFKEYKFKTKDLIKILNTSDSRFYRDID
ncbi:replication initiation protein, partial [Clostridium botulinum]|nr:replication initiation protein [Clostridium botulinum]